VWRGIGFVHWCPQYLKADWQWCWQLVFATMSHWGVFGTVILSMSRTFNDQFAKTRRMLD